MNHVSIGWEWLETTLNQLIDEVNMNRPLPSASLATEQSPNGTIVRLVPKGDDTQKQPVSAGGGDGKGQIPGYFWVTLYDVAAQKVTIVDPVTCAQSQITVFVSQPGSGVKFQAKIELGVPPG